jgi:DNA-binding transcriptional ArsR family regulator
MAHAVDLGELARRGMRAGIDAHTSSVMLAVDALAAPPEAPFAASIVGELEPAHRAALSPMLEGKAVPDVVVRLAERDRRPSERIRRVATADPLDLYRQLADCPWVVPDAWDHVLRSPERWLMVVANAIARLMPVTRALLAAERDALSRLVARVQAARRPDAVRHVLAPMLARSRLTDRTWELHPDGDPLRVHDDGLLVLPVLTPPERSLVAAERSTVTTLIAGVTTSDKDHWALEALLGGIRCRLLRLLDEPRTMTAVGEATRLTPSAATYHVAALERMGLAHRTRRGRFVLVQRTQRGDALLSVYRIGPLGVPGVAPT